MNLEENSDFDFLLGKRKILNLRGTDVESFSSWSVGSDEASGIVPSLFLWWFFIAIGSLIFFGFVFSVFIGGEVQSLVTIVGTGLISFGDVLFVISGNVSNIDGFPGCRGGLWAASRVLFGKTVRILFTSEVTGSI